MKKHLPAAPLILLSIGAIVWLLWPDQTASTLPVAHSSTPSGALTKDTSSIPSQADATASSGLTPEEEQILSKTAETMREFDLLCAPPDNIDKFKQRAELENNFFAKLDGATAELLVQHMPAGFVDSYFGGRVLAKWATTNRKEAAAWMASHPGNTAVAASSLEEGWFNEDPQGLQTYLDGLADSPWKNYVVKAAGEEAFVAKDPTDSIALLDQIPGPDGRRDELYGYNVTAWAMQDPATAIQWAEQVGDPTLRQKLLTAAAIGQAHSDPQTAAAWVAANVTDKENLGNAATAIVRIWAAKDPQSSANWVTQFPAGPTRDGALEGLLSIWAGNNPAQATAWQKSITDPALQEQAGQILQKLQSPPLAIGANTTAAPSP